MADSFTVKVKKPSDVKVGDEVKVVPRAMPSPFPGMMPVRMDPKMGKVESIGDTFIKTDVAGKVYIPPKKGEMFNWDIFKKSEGGRRRKTRGRKARRYTRRR